MPHRGLEGKTPVERFLEDQEHVRPAPETLERMMRMKVQRRVGRDRTVRLEGRLFETPDGWAGEKIEVFYDPYDPAAKVTFKGRGEPEEMTLRRLDLTTNARLPRPVRPGKKIEVATGKAEATTGISYLELVASRFYGPEK